MSEQMRSEFEAWAMAKGRTCKRDGEGYAYSVTCSEWHSWQASRSALCVELPRIPDFDISVDESLEIDPDEYDSAEFEHSLQCETIRMCRDAIHAAGVKTK